MATLGNQAESNRIVEPVTKDVQRTAHASITAANPTTYGTSAGTKFDADQNSTTNYATPQGEKVLMDIQLDQGVKLAAPGGTQKTGDAPTDQTPTSVDGNPKFQMQSDKPGLVVTKGPLTADDIPNIENIGGGAYQSKEINGVPITPQMAAEVRSAEDKAGHDTGRDSASARVQSAAAYNVRENIVPPIGVADHTARGVIGGDSVRRQSRIRVEHGAHTYANPTY
jgi:hypothetical protein